LLHGALGRAGHLGHVSIDPDGPSGITRCPGSLEYAIGNYSLGRRTGDRYPSTQALLDAMNAGDPGAREIWMRSIKQLAAAIASIINVVDPELLVIGGGIAQAGEALFTPLRQYLDTFEWRPHGRSVRIAAAAGGEFAGAIGAAYHAMRFTSEKAPHDFTR
jgi:glucokinase